ncbi:MAG TPA: hypothetical protein VLJ59_11175 [Mycobacteriales bacterium]|nr:hypothetical protein [Mycobacteriales bacterium]
MPFDPASYEQEVLRPLRGRSGPLPGDLLVRYAVTTTMDRPDLETHLRHVRTLWNQRRSGRGSLAEVCNRLLSADDELKRASDMTDPAWWRTQAHAHDAKIKPMYDRLVGDLRAEHGATGLVTRARLERVAASTPDLGLARVAAAAAAAGLTVVDAVDLPTDSGLDRTIYQSLRGHLGELAVGTVVHLLHPAPAGPYTLVSAFAVAGDPGARLDRATLDLRTIEAEQAADSPMARARKSALSILRTGLANGADLRMIALFHVVDRLRQAHLGEALLLSMATDLGLDRADAALVVANLPAGEAVPKRGLAEVGELLERGQLSEAEAALTVLPASSPDHATARSLVEAARARFDRLVRDAEAAVAAGREGTAEQLLAQAAAIDADDAGLARLSERVPPAPPRDVTATAAGGVVRLAWRAPLSRAAQVRYRVVRAEGRTPASERDGVVVAETTDSHAQDPRPPVARDLRYAVFASSGRVWSRPATTALTVLPPVSDIKLRVDADHVLGVWVTQPGVVGVRVRRTVGRPPAGPDDGIVVPVSSGSFTDREVEEGVEYFYAVTAVYRDPAGRRLDAATQVESAVPRGAAQAVGDLMVRVADQGSTGRVLLSWSGTGEVRIRRAATAPPWKQGTTVPVRLVEEYGREVAGPRRSTDGLTSMEAEIPPGHHVYVPFAIGGTGAVVGAPVVMGMIEPVRDLRARRNDDLVVLSWVWPDQVGIAEVAWTSSDGGTQSRRISRAQYADENGCRLPAGRGGIAEVRTVDLGPNGTAVSPPVVVTVSGPAVRLWYTIARPAGWRNALSRQRVVTVRVDRTCVDLTIQLVLCVGRVMPVRAEQGTDLYRQDRLALADGTPHTFEVGIPAAVRKPYWLRLFVPRPSGVVVLDPPVAEMKVS